jgi:hypothetical protein
VTFLIPCVVAVLAALLAGCSDESAREGATGETGPSPRAAPPTITEADSGESFSLPRDSQTSLRLSGEYLWSEPKVRGDAVQLTPVNYFQDPGFSEWSVLAVRPGTATIAAQGTPACAGEAGCADDPLGVQIEIVVAP